MGVIGAYDLLVYCDGPHEVWAKPQIEVSGPNHTECLKQVRESGWKIIRDGSVSQWGNGKAFCPACNKKERKMWEQ